ncbi:MAG: VWA domain-containing protein [Chloroflexota bacterium]
MTDEITQENLQGNLLQNCVLFGRLLRALSIEVTPTQMVDWVDSLGHVDIGNRQDFKNSARAILVSHKEELPRFDEAFDIFWQERPENIWQDIDMGKLIIKRQQKPEIQSVSDNDDGGGGDENDREPEPHLDTVYTYSDTEVLRQKDFGKLDPEELAKMRRIMQAIEWRVEPRRTRRMTPTSRGDMIDMRRTLRRNLRNGGELLHLAQKERKLKRRPIVLICDISGSMERYSRILLQFVYIVSSRLDRVESFVFSTRLTRITRQLQTRDVDQALDEASALIHDWAGGTRIGEAIRTFNYDWARRVLGQGAVVMVISDGWDRGDVDVLGYEMDRLHRSCHKLIWLNPLLGSEGYEPLVRGIQAALPHVDEFLPVHNLASLEQLAELLRNT